jgi:hypothetical protein
MIQQPPQTLFPRIIPIPKRTYLAPAANGQNTAVEMQASSVSSERDAVAAIG